MITYLEGKIILKKEKFIILAVNGVGFKVFLSQKALLKIPEVSQNLKLFCFLDVRENNLNLYGFLNFEELELFEVLNNIPGVGPKIALEISALGPLKKLKEALEKEGEKIFKGIPGIGKKRTRAIVLELSEKIKEIPKEKTAKTDEAEEALINLGFSKKLVKETLSKIPKEIQGVEKRIKAALKILGR